MSRRTKPVPIGPLSSKSAGARHFMLPAQNFAQPTRVTNSMMRDVFVQEARWADPPRAGSLAFMQLPSKGDR
jgi:hypothetical protein